MGTGELVRSLVATMRIMCCGDSITVGFGPYQGGYRRFVMNAYRGVEFVGSQQEVGGVSVYGRCEGYGGQTTTQVLANTLATLSSMSTSQLPDVVLWMTGTNDMATNSEDPAVIFAAASAVLDTPSVTTIFVSSPPPRRTDNARYAQTTAFRAAMAAYFAAPLPAGMHHCDVGAALTDAGFVDETHPNNDVGYPLIGAGWIAAMAAAGIVPRTNRQLGYGYSTNGGVWF